jgi:Tol biopolymer transport system component
MSRLLSKTPLYPSEVGKRKMAKNKSFYRTYGKCLLFLINFFLLASLSIWFGPRFFYRQWGHFWLKTFESRLTEKQINDIQKGLQGLRAKIIWSSSRTGNHEIFLLTLPDLKMFQITHNKHVNYFPRFSPDGEKIIFCRSQRPWVSERDVAPWDVYLFSLINNRESLIARNANTPQWINDNQISFVRENKFMVRDLETGREELLLDGNRSPVSSEIGTPEISPQNPGLLAFTGRGKLDGVFVMDREKNSILKIGQGCEITWDPSGQEVIWVDNGGNGGTRILKSSITHIQQTLFMDLPGPYSHEYFPRFSRNGKWLVWAASAGGHEHDIADYEIFLWRVGTPFNQAVRLTYNPANDRWPDIYLEK